MKWKTRWGYEMAATPTRRGIYRLKDGGYFVRARVTNRLGKRREVSAVLRETKTTTEAQAELDKLVADARAEAHACRSGCEKEKWLARPPSTGGRT
jgi:hypothetical protein